jgi:hypothetical protein
VKCDVYDLESIEGHDVIFVWDLAVMQGNVNFHSSKKVWTNYYN